MGIKILSREYWLETLYDCLWGTLRRMTQPREMRKLDKAVARALRLTDHYQLWQAHKRNDSYVWTLKMQDSAAKTTAQVGATILDEVRRSEKLHPVVMQADPHRVEIARSEPIPLALSKWIGKVEGWKQNQFCFSPGLFPTVGSHQMAKLSLEDPRCAQILISGGTGSGKTTLGMGVLVTLALNTSPEQLRVIVVDPKVVDMANSAVGQLPHLAMPVITRIAVAQSAINSVWLELEARREQAEQYTATGRKWHIPNRILLYIDELYDLVAIDETITGTLSRIASIGRGLGVHLIVGTQRATVDVVPGHLRSNMPLRFAGWVRSAEESKIATGLPQSGAERIFLNGHFVMIRRSEQLTLHGYALDSEGLADTVGKIHSRWGGQKATSLPLSFAAVEPPTKEEPPIIQRIMEELEHGAVSLNRINELGMEVEGSGIGRVRARRLLEQAISNQKGTNNG